MTRKDIAEQVGVTQKTLRGWINAGDWDSLREAKTITRQQLLNDSYAQLSAVNKQITDEHGGVPTKALSDAKAVLIKEIEALSDLPLHKLLSVFHEVTTWLNDTRPHKLLEITELLNDFIEDQIAAK